MTRDFFLKKKKELKIENVRIVSKSSRATCSVGGSVKKQQLAYKSWLRVIGTVTAAAVYIYIQSKKFSSRLVLVARTFRI